MEKRTDLAMEIRESFKRDNVEVKGVVLEKEQYDEGRIKVTTVEIVDERGSKAMGKPKGTYITLEFMEEERENMEEMLVKNLQKIDPRIQDKSVMIAGLGNIEVTSDSLGPKVIQSLYVTRHMEKEFGKAYIKESELGVVSAIAPGVMAQTGMESFEILSGLVKEIKPQVVIVIDALASRSLSRLCQTIQLTDTGISPGSGVGNHRKEITEKSLGIPVIAIGVPTVVDAWTIISDHMENVLCKQGYSQKEIESFLSEVNEKEMENVFVTPKNIDESVGRLSEALATVLNRCFHNEPHGVI